MSKVRKFVPGRDQRIAAIRHIVYEYGNLMAAGYYSIHGQPPWRTNCDDAFLLGCRKLADFLIRDNRSKKDVLARDYVTTKPICMWKLPIWTAKWRITIDEHLAHISYSRVSYSGDEWNHLIQVPGLLKEFNNAWWDFRVSVTDKGYSEEFDRQLQYCQAKEGFGNKDGLVFINLGRQ